MKTAGEDSPKAEDRTTLPEWLALSLVTISGGLLAGWVIWRAGYGFEFSDEGFYLNWISHPSLYKASVTQFGFIYHPLFLLLRGNLVLFRRVNLAITVALGWALCFALLMRNPPTRPIAGRRRTLPFGLIAFALACPALASLDPWLPTPSYYSLTLQSLLVAGTALALAERKPSWRSDCAWALFGLALWLAFMAKPTTAAALGAVAALYFLTSRRLNLRGLALAFAAAAVLGILFAWFVDGSPAGFAQRLSAGYGDLSLLKGGHSLSLAVRIDSYALASAERIALWAGIALIFLATWSGLATSMAARIWCPLFAIMLAIACTSTVVGVFVPGWEPGIFQKLQFWAVPAGTLLAFLAASGRRISTVFSLERWSLPACLALFPYVYAFGSNGNYVVVESRAGVFWVLAGVSVLFAIPFAPVNWRAFLPAASAAQAGTAVFLFFAMAHPYRGSQPLWQQEDAWPIPGSGSLIGVSRDVSVYVRDLDRLAESAGFRAGEPMLDLTGHYPGALFAIGAKAIGQPWVIGGYKGSEDLAVASLRRIARSDIRHAWILTEPSGPRRLSPGILAEFGLNLGSDYVDAGTIESPTGEFPTSFRQHLYRPAR